MLKLVRGRNIPSEPKAKKSYILVDKKVSGILHALTPPLQHSATW